MVFEIATLPGVILGSASGSMWRKPFHGTPGVNSGGPISASALKINYFVKE